MHELSIATAIIDACTERALGARVRRVRLEIGRLSAIMPDALRFCFDICAQNTPLEGAELEIVEIPGRAFCRDCQTILSLEALFGSCTCGSSNLEVVAGEELRIKEMEIV